MALGESLVPGWLQGPPVARGEKTPVAPPLEMNPLVRVAYPGLTKRNYPDGVWGVLQGDGKDLRVFEEKLRRGEKRAIEAYRAAMVFFNSLPE